MLIEKYIELFTENGAVLISAKHKWVTESSTYVKAINQKLQPYSNRKPAPFYVKGSLL